MQALLRSKHARRRSTTRRSGTVAAVFVPRRRDESNRKGRYGYRVRAQIADPNPDVPLLHMPQVHEISAKVQSMRMADVSHV